MDFLNKICHRIFRCHRNCSREHTKREKKIHQTSAPYFDNPDLRALQEDLRIQADMRRIKEYNASILIPNSPIPAGFSPMPIIIPDPPEVNTGECGGSR